MEQVLTLMVVSYGIALAALWLYISRARKRLPASILPSGDLIRTGGLLLCIWSDAHRRTGDAWLSRLVQITRVTFVLTLLAIILRIFLVEPSAP